MLILLADDHKVVRRGLRDIMAAAFPHADFVEAATGDEVLGALSLKPCQLVVLDINMPGRTGIDLLSDVKRLYPQTAVLMLSVQPEDQYAIRCLKTGASGYLCKDSAEEELIKAARKVVSGGRYVSATLAEKLASDLQQPASKDPHELLSDRELEVMRMLASGVSLTSIADSLHVSVKTVSTYRNRCLLKMNLQSNAELVRYALQHNLIG